MKYKKEETDDEAFQKAKKKLTEIYADMVKGYKTDDMMDVLIYKEKWTPELVDGVKNKILTLSRN